MDWNELRKPFTSSEVKQRQGPGGKRLDYVAIETVLERLLTVAPEYSWAAEAPDLRMNVGGDGWTAVVTGHLSVPYFDERIERWLLKTATGVGAMVHRDPDMAVKSANSEAMKNAAKNGFGVALELWSEDHRASLATDRALAAGDLPTLKAAVYSRAVEGLSKTRPSANEVADFHNVPVSDLNNQVALKQILGL